MKQSKIYEYEIQIKCPFIESFDSHIQLMSQINKISQNHNIEQILLNTDPKRLLITWIVKFTNPQDQANAIVESMALLSKNSVVPGEMIYQKEISSSKKHLKKLEEKQTKTLEILENV
tara:strand:- start:215 stop:568 length:354 start_codon:yes stop_codon:yes gene_type:complete